MKTCSDRTTCNSSLAALLLLLFSFAATPLSKAQFTFWTNDGAITITKYVGTNRVVNVPSTINGLPVVSLWNDVFANNLQILSISIPGTVTNMADGVFSSCNNVTNVTIPTSVTGLGAWPFYGCSNLTRVVIPAGIRKIGDRAFQNCVQLSGVYFRGNAPTFDFSTFYGATNAVVYFLPGTTGWDSALSGLKSGFHTNSVPVPYAVWQPLMEVSDKSFGVQNGVFGFTVSWASGMSVAVDASTGLEMWTAVQTNILATDSLYFRDSQWTNYPRRFYRLRWP